MPETPAKKAPTKKTAPSAAPPSPPTGPEAVWAALTAPFPAEHIEKLPKTLKARDDDRGTCQAGGRYSADGFGCGKYHARAVHLDYVGHAGITTRLNDVLGPGGWDFQPLAKTPEGLPIISASAFWGQLSVTIGEETVTKWDVAADFKGPQEALGDCLRRRAMRLGIGTYLWSKSDAALEKAKATEPEPEPAQRQEPERQPDPVTGPQGVAPHIQALWDTMATLSDDERSEVALWWDNWSGQGGLPPKEHSAHCTPPQAEMVQAKVRELRTPPVEDPPWDQPSGAASSAAAGQDPR